MIKSIILPLVLILMLFPSLSHATSIDVEADRKILLTQLSMLIQEVTRLQNLLQGQLVVQQSITHPGVQKSTKSGYRYDLGPHGLVAQNSALIAPEHQSVFSLLEETLGRELVRQKVSSFTIGYVDEDSFDRYVEGYVELLPYVDTWEFVVRRNTRSIPDALETRLLQDLFIHEYGHMLAYDRPGLIEDFTDTFWNSQTFSLAKRIQEVFDRKGFVGLDSIHEEYKNTFVSGYAMLDPDEDFSETLVAFVREDRPYSNTVRNQKIRFLYSDPELVGWRLDIRKNIGVYISDNPYHGAR